MLCALKLATRGTLCVQMRYWRAVETASEEQQRCNSGYEAVRGASKRGPSRLMRDSQRKVVKFNWFDA